MRDLMGITQDILAKLKPDMLKAQSTGYAVDLGLTGYELEAPSKKLFPVLAPFRNRVPRRKAPIGSQAARWKAITKINANRARPTPGFGRAANLVETEVLEFMAPYKVIGLGDSVHMDAQMLAQGFEDLRATAGINLLYALMIEEDRLLLGAQNFALERPAAPTLTALATGGAIPAGTTIYVSVAARTLENYFYGGGSLASEEANVSIPGTSGGSNAVDAFVPAVRGAVAYDWYVGTTAGSLYYYTTTAVNKVRITDIPTGDRTLPNDLPDLTPARTYAETKTDTSANPDAFNGLIATCAGHYLNGALVTPGTPGSTPTGAVIKSLDGGKLSGVDGSIPEIDEVLLELWNRARISPTRMLVNAQQHIDITNAVLRSSGGGGAFVLFRPDQAGERSNLVAGALLAQYLNKAVNGRPIPIETMPHLPPGTIVLITEVLPYPNNEVTNVFEVETQQEYQQIEYAMSRQVGQLGGGPRYDTEVRAIETFKNYFPAGCAVISNIAPGVSP